MNNKNNLFKLAAAATAIGTAAVIAGAAISRINKAEKSKNRQSTLPQGFTFTAHTGCAGTKDNSLESIDKAIEYGADIVEFDLHFTADKVPVLSHDEPSGGEVTLDEAFRKVSEYENLKVNVDVKSCAALDKVAPLAEKHGILNRIFYTGVFSDHVPAVKEQSPGIKYFLNMDVKSEDMHTDEYLQSLAEAVKANGAVGINMNKNNATQALVDYFHAAGLLVSVWTVNSESDMRKMLSLAPDNITTKSPDIFRKVLDSLAENGYN